MKLDRKDTSAIVDEAVARFLSLDIDLIELDVSELAISGKLACYIQEIVRREKLPHDVDVEYNRHINEVKRVHNYRKVCPSHPRANKPLPPGLRPDIVIHKRKRDDFNTLAIEIKKMPFSNEFEEEAHDFCKLAALTFQTGRPDYLYKYSHGLWLVFELIGKGVKPHFVWFSEGNIEPDQDLPDEITQVIAKFKSYCGDSRE